MTKAPSALDASPLYTSILTHYVFYTSNMSGKEKEGVEKGLRQSRLELIYIMHIINTYRT